jgi:hypothetical protein
MRIQSIIISLSLLTSAASFASSTTLPDDYPVEVGNSETPNAVLEKITQLKDMPRAELFNPKSPVSEITDIGKIVNLGQKSWTVIKSNKPKANVEYIFANAIPKGLTSSEDLANFSDIQTTTFHFGRRNYLGIKVIDIAVTAIHQRGGTYNGQGHYLENVALIPAKIDVKFGFSADFEVTSITTTNVGTDENPIASLTMMAKFTHSSLSSLHEERVLIQFRGDSDEVKVIRVPNE